MLNVFAVQIILIFFIGLIAGAIVLPIKFWHGWGVISTIIVLIGLVLVYFVGL